MALPMPKEFLEVPAGEKRDVTFKSSATGTNVSVSSVSILTDVPLYIATNESVLAIQATGIGGQRIYIPGGENFLSIPWGKNTTLWLQNVDVVASVRIQIIGVV